ncbi:hypothetical protein Xoosp13_151 [Xanthomonas phage Xoo-sp13]|nr:hypothetical protein Xoosp13_151 [Xanthomonas phage Xoo-sp13]
MTSGPTVKISDDDSKRFMEELFMFHSSGQLYNYWSLDNDSVLICIPNNVDVVRAKNAEIEILVNETSIVRFIGSVAFIRELFRNLNCRIYDNVTYKSNPSNMMIHSNDNYMKKLSEFLKRWTP